MKVKEKLAKDFMIGKKNPESIYHSFAAGFEWGKIKMMFVVEDFYREHYSQDKEVTLEDLTKLRTQLEGVGEEEV